VNIQPRLPRPRFLLAACATVLLAAGFESPDRAAGDPLAGGVQASTPHFAPLLSKRHAAYALVGGAATWLVFEHENAAATARTLDTAPLELGGDIGNEYGTGGVLAAGTLGLWTAGRIAGNRNVTGAAHDLATGLVLDGALVFALKNSIDRTRPNGQHWSFPSGHASSAFTVAPILASHFGWRVGIPAYALAVATGIGRIEDHWHYPSDVVAGATLGLIVGESVAHHSRSLPLADNLYVGHRGLGVKFGF
jgi:membrane-associated phospholipid phosphatase